VSAGVKRAYIGMGSNLGDRAASLRAALAALDATPGVQVAATSSTYESEPWGVTDQPAFANAVVAIDTDLGPLELLRALKAIEAAAGRTAGVRNGPRSLDLDLLLFGSDTVDLPELAVPHPRLLERDFVVTPLLEVAPGVTLPDGTPITRGLAIEGRVTGRL
jgi:2-amino-4-hydroxy-6-hydroxymethyldihydropteridine diphosphokinase